jgi:hypothetical protein
MVYLHNLFLPPTLRLNTISTISISISREGEEANMEEMDLDMMVQC